MFLAISIPSMLIVMSISHPRLRSFSLEASLRTPAALAAWVGMVHYISTVMWSSTDKPVVQRVGVSSPPCWRLYRVLSLENFFLGLGETDLKIGEIVQSITYPLPPAASKGGYSCLGRNNLADLAIAAVTVLAYPDESATSGYRFRIALSAVAPTVIMVTAAQDLLSVAKVNDKCLQRAARHAVQSCKPIDDIRASKAYRIDMVHTLTLNALREVWKKLQS